MKKLESKRFYDWIEITDELEKQGYKSDEIRQLSDALFHVSSNGCLVSLAHKEDRDSDEYCKLTDKTREIADAIEELTESEARIHYWW